MTDTGSTLVELEAFREELDAHGVAYLGLLEVSRWRPWADLALDAAAIGLATALVATFGWAWAPLALLVVGNRQRALGNLLHDTAHRTTHRSIGINDWIGSSVLAPLAFMDLRHYRILHFLHHMQLGQPQTDPDYLARRRGGRSGWFAVYLRFVFTRRRWWRSVSGHLGDSAVSSRRRVRIAAWWIGACALLAASAGWRDTGVFLALWMVSRATAFHLITTFREMCDHRGLVHGSAAPFRRDVLRRSLWYTLVHPRSDGYHLTHHLLPAVPYYRLPKAQRLFREMPSYRARGRAHSCYVIGPDPVVASWSIATPSAH